MTHPLVSTIISNHNYARYVSTPIDSALGLTYRQIEVVVVDDGSTDELRDVLSSYAGLTVTVLQDRAGPRRCLQRRVCRSRGDIL